MGDEITFLRYLNPGAPAADVRILGEGHDGRPTMFWRGKIVSIRPDSYEIDVMDFKGHVWRMKLDWFRIHRHFGRDFYAERLKTHVETWGAKI